MSIRSYFRKFKIRAKTFYFIICLTVLEVILLLWSNDWAYTPAIIPVFIQFALIFERREKWKQLTDEEKEKIMISENDITGLVKGIESLFKEGYDSDTIIAKIKGD